MQPMQPSPSRAFVPGAKLEPAEALAAWLGAQGDRVLRVPLVVERGVTGVRGGRIGSLAVDVDDAALGIALFDRVRKACATDPCIVWVEGRFEAAGAGQDRPTLHVLRFDRVVGAGDVSDVVGVEAADGQRTSE